MQHKMLCCWISVHRLLTGGPQGMHSFFQGLSTACSHGRAGGWTAGLAVAGAARNGYSTTGSAAARDARATL